MACLLRWSGYYGNQVVMHVPYSFTMLVSSFLFSFYMPPPHHDACCLSSTTLFTTDIKLLNPSDPWLKTHSGALKRVESLFDSFSTPWCALGPTPNPTLSLTSSSLSSIRTKPYQSPQPPLSPLYILAFSKLHFISTYQIRTLFQISLWEWVFGFDKD